MSNVINELASIEVSSEVLEQLDVDGIYRSFSKNYRKLDDLNKFRTEYEKKNWLMRWWHNDKLQGASLDSAEVQAEFSKTIGQLMMIIIIQSKKLSEQQTQLNDQQGKLKSQADEIEKQAGKLQEQHQVLAEQSQKLEALVREYFELKGLTEDGAQKLIDIAHEVKATKDQMLQAFDSRTKGVGALCAEVQSLVERISTQIHERIRLSEEQTLASIVDLRRDTREALDFYETSQRTQHEAAQNTLNQDLEKLAESQLALATALQSKQAAFDLRFSDLLSKRDQQIVAHREKLDSIDAAVKSLSAQAIELDVAIAGAKAELFKSGKQQQSQKEAMATFKQEVFSSLKRFHYFAAGISIVLVGVSSAAAYMVK